MGYAPPEQMSGGQVYPSTDLYALAVTCLTLLTGKQPNELFDTYSNQWNWRTYAQVSPQLARILDRMLLSSPNQRFDSAQEVLAALSASQIRTPSAQTTSVVTPANPSSPHIPVRPRFSLAEVLGVAAFSGFEGGLIAIALSSLPLRPGISMGLTVAIVGSLIYAQYRRILEGKDLPILIAITLAITIVFRNALVPAWIITIFGNPIVGVLFVAWLAAAGAIAVTAMFRLIYKLLYLIL
jgi:serine/threonine-protein kinase